MNHRRAAGVLVAAERGQEGRKTGADVLAEDDRHGGRPRDHAGRGQRLQNTDRRGRRLEQRGNQRADQNTEEQGFAHDTELLLHAFRIDVELVKTGDEIKSFIDEQRKGDETLTERLGNGNALHLIVVTLELFGCEVGHNQGNDITDDGCKEAPPDISGSEIDNSTDKGEMPIVP